MNAQLLKGPLLLISAASLVFAAILVGAFLFLVGDFLFEDTSYTPGHDVLLSGMLAPFYPGDSEIGERFGDWDNGYMQFEVALPEDLPSYWADADKKAETAGWRKVHQSTVRRSYSRPWATAAPEYGEEFVNIELTPNERTMTVEHSREGATYKGRGGKPFTPNV